MIQRLTSELFRPASKMTLVLGLNPAARSSCRLEKLGCVGCRSALRDRQGEFVNSDRRVWDEKSPGPLVEPLKSQCFFGLGHSHRVNGLLLESFKHG